VPAEAVTAPQENRKPGENPGRYRHCMRGGTHRKTKVGHWGNPRRLCGRLRYASQENCSNEVMAHGSASTDSVVFCCGKRLQRPFTRVAAAFLLWPSVWVFPLDPLIALAVTACDTTEYCLSMGLGDPVGNRNNRPLLCLAQVHKSESQFYGLGLPRYDRRVQPSLSVLADEWAALLACAETTSIQRRDASDTGGKEGLGGGPSASETC